PCRARGRCAPTSRPACLAGTRPAMFPGRERAGFERLAAAVRSPLFGGDCFNYGQVASGYMDLVVEASLKPFDFAALVPILAGAGGVCTDWQGRALRLDSDGHVIAAGDARVPPAAPAMLAACLGSRSPARTLASPQLTCRSCAGLAQSPPCRAGG